MTYVTVKEETDQKIHVCREPTTRSWAILLGLVSLGIGAAYYSMDYLLWKIAYLSGSVFVGLSCMEDWEDCILDKTEKKVTIKRQSLMQKIFRTADGQKQVVADLDDIVSVDVQEEEVKYSGIGYIVVLNFGSGYSMGVTETTSVGSRFDQDLLAEKLQQFLQLDSKPEGPTESPVSEMPTTEEAVMSPIITMTTALDAAAAAAEDLSSTDSDESFEQIDKSEIPDNIETIGAMEPEEDKNEPQEPENTSTMDQEEPENTGTMDQEEPEKNGTMDQEEPENTGAMDQEETENLDEKEEN